jgi:hypothetical protein
MFRAKLFVSTASSALLALAISAGDATAQGMKALAGSYSIVSSGSMVDGKRVETYGEKPKGMLILNGDGRYQLSILRNDLPKFTSNARVKGTVEENKAVVGGSINHFGRYSVDEKEKTITFNIEASIFPNWAGTTQKRPFTLKGGTLTYQVQASSGGTGAGEVVWQRNK